MPCQLHFQVCSYRKHPVLLLHKKKSKKPEVIVFQFDIEKSRAALRSMSPLNSNNGYYEIKETVNAFPKGTFVEILGIGPDGDIDVSGPDATGKTIVQVVTLDDIAFI